MITAYVKGDILDRNGKVIKRNEFVEAHSFLSNFIRIMYVQFANLGLAAIRTSGASGNLGTGVNNLRISAAANDPTYGMQIGSGTNVPTLGDNALQTQITANVYHLGTNIFLTNPSSSSMEVIITRSFLNNTGSALAITEIGLVTAATDSGNLYLIDRTLYSISVPKALSIAFTYKIGITL